MILAARLPAWPSTAYKARPHRSNLEITKAYWTLFCETHNALNPLLCHVHFLPPRRVNQPNRLSPSSTVKCEQVGFGVTRLTCPLCSFLQANLPHVLLLCNLLSPQVLTAPPTTNRSGLHCATPLLIPQALLISCPDTLNPTVAADEFDVVVIQRRRVGVIGHLFAQVRFDAPNASAIR